MASKEEMKSELGDADATRFGVVDTREVGEGANDMKFAEEDASGTTEANRDFDTMFDELFEGMDDDDVETSSVKMTSKSSSSTLVLGL